MLHLWLKFSKTMFFSSVSSGQLGIKDWAIKSPFEFQSGQQLLTVFFSSQVRSSVRLSGLHDKGQCLVEEQSAGAFHVHLSKGVDFEGIGICW